LFNLDFGLNNKSRIIDKVNKVAKSQNLEFTGVLRVPRSGFLVRQTFRAAPGRNREFERPDAREDARLLEHPVVHALGFEPLPFHSVPGGARMQV
jgi:hypothetical protein